VGVEFAGAAALSRGADTLYGVMDAAFSHLLELLLRWSTLQGYAVWIASEEVPRGAVLEGRMRGGAPLDAAAWQRVGQKWEQLGGEWGGRRSPYRLTWFALRP